MYLSFIKTYQIQYFCPMIGLCVVWLSSKLLFNMYKPLALIPVTYARACAPPPHFHFSKAWLFDIPLTASVGPSTLYKSSF